MEKKIDKLTDIIAHLPDNKRNFAINLIKEIAIEYNRVIEDNLKLSAQNNGMEQTEYIETMKKAIKMVALLGVSKHEFETVSSKTLEYLEDNYEKLKDRIVPGKFLDTHYWLLTKEM
jgi:hypothetical protein